jgi:hypothetical protein
LWWYLWDRLSTFAVCRTSAYDPAKSQVSADALAAFIASDIEGPLTQVPGLGRSAVDKLVDVGITNTFQLLGKFLMLKVEVLWGARGVRARGAWGARLDWVGGLGLGGRMAVGGEG